MATTKRTDESLKKIGVALANAEVFVDDAYDEALPPISLDSRIRNYFYQCSDNDLCSDEPHNLSNLMHDSSRDAINAMIMVIKMSLELDKTEVEILLDILLDNMI